MEHKFGIFKTVEELNRAAAAQKAEGDLEALIRLALENDLDREDAEDYLEDRTDCLCTPYMAAVGKLERESAKLNLQSQLKDWKDYIIQMAEESEELCQAVFAKEDRLKDVMAAGLKQASKARIRVDKAIIQAAGLPESAAYIGMCGRDEIRRIVRNCYLGGDKA